MTSSTALFFVPVILIMIVPTMSTIIHAQETTETTTFSSPQSANNITAVINSTALGGIQDMRQLSSSLGAEIQRENLTNTFNEIVMAFAYIQGNLTALQNHTNNIITEAAAAAAEAQREAQDARADALTETPAEDSEEVEEPELEEGDTISAPAAIEAAQESESESESETETSSTTEEQEQEQEQNNGPRLDPEGDGGFPGDLDG